MGNPSQSYGASLAIWDHTVLPATWHKWTRPAITPANQAGTRFTYPRGMEGWVDLGSLIAARWESKPRLLDRKSDTETVTPPIHPLLTYTSKVGIFVGTFSFYFCLVLLLTKVYRRCWLQVMSLCLLTIALLLFVSVLLWNFCSFWLADDLFQHNLPGSVDNSEMIRLYDIDRVSLFRLQEVINQAYQQLNVSVRVLLMPVVKCTATEFMSLITVCRTFSKTSFQRVIRVPLRVCEGLPVKQRQMYNTVKTVWGGFMDCVLSMAYT